MSGLHPLPPNPLQHSSSPRHDVPPPLPSDDSRLGFSRSGFAPIPHRHHDLPPPPIERDAEREWSDRRDGRSGWDGRGDPEMDLGGDLWDRREDRDRRPPPRTRDVYDGKFIHLHIPSQAQPVSTSDRSKRRRSPSPLGPSHRARMHSPSPPPRYPPAPSLDLPDPADLPHLLNFRQFADWFRASHPQTAKADEEELRRVREAIEAGQGDGLGKERVGMGKRYERYRKEYTSRQVGRSFSFVSSS